MNSNQRGKPRGARPKKHTRTIGTACVWPRGVELRYDISAPTRWRWEKLGMLPPRDVFVGGKAVGWKPETLACADSGQAAA
jgi:predicted DNA-binding transcriptional regulator AlpA